MMAGWLRRRWGTSGSGARIGAGLAVLVLLAYGVGAMATRGPADVTDGADAAVPEGAGAEGLGHAPGVAAGGPPVAAEVDARSAGGPAAATADTGAEEPSAWSAPTAPSPIEPLPASERVPRPAAVRGIYVGSWPMGSATRLEQLIRLADVTEVNAFVIDVKDVTGEVSYGSRVPLAEQVGATAEPRIHDIRGLLARLREHGIYPIARIVVFKDPLLAMARPEWSIERADGTLWVDNNDVPWVDSYNRDVWDYNIELAREAIALGFSEIQWDYVRFPDVPGSYLVEAVYPAREGRAKTDGIREFLLHARERLADTGAPLTADVFGITTSTRSDIGIGQVWEKMADAVDVLLPMVYPSHYPDGSWQYDNPNAAPYQIVKRAMDDGVERSRLIPNTAGIRPWLQAFSMGDPDYGPRHIRAQIDAVYDAGLTEWILWSPSARYPAEAFATADGADPWFAGMGASLYQPDPVPVVEPVTSPDTLLGTPIPPPAPRPVSGGG